MAKRWVVGLKKFFNRLNHDVLMARAVRQVREPRVLRLIADSWRPGWQADKVKAARQQETPQGGPLSPLLWNILLTDLDLELERRKLSFCGCADDCNVYVGSERVWPLVECRGPSHARSPAAKVLHEPRSGLAGGNPPASPASCLNRRMQARVRRCERAAEGAIPHPTQCYPRQNRCRCSILVRVFIANRCGKRSMLSAPSGLGLL